jgi:facilitated trehalose transporter
MDRGKPMRQIVAALLANIGTINTGMIFGYSAVAIPQLLESDSKVHVNEEQASWIGKYPIYVQLRFFVNGFTLQLS